MASVVKRARRSLLFTPGPLSLSITTRRAMLRDAGSRDNDFIATIARVRSRLLALAHVSSPSHECVLMQGSGTFGVESVIGSSVPRAGGKLLVAVNGAYGERMLKMARVLGIETAAPIVTHERRALDVSRVVDAAASDPSVTHVAVVHHETTAGVLNDVHAIGARLAALPHAPTFIVDSMSAFGAYDVDVAASKIDFLVSSANKCIEGAPGFSFTIAEASALSACAGNARSLSLDLHAQCVGLSGNGQFRFTPPTHAIRAFDQALTEHEGEGGVAGRLARYARNHEVLLKGMAELGFTPYVEQDAGCIITTFLTPQDPAFRFDDAYKALAARGCVIYPGKTTVCESFRIGSIGRLFERDMRRVVRELRAVLRDQGVALPVKQTVAV